jgi:hypothetical protein
MDRPLKLKNKSSQIHEGSTYDPRTERLTTVLNGATVAYHNVPQFSSKEEEDRGPGSIEGLENAESPGSYFHRHIRPHYQYSRVR